MAAIRNNAESAVREFLIATYDRFDGKPLRAIDFMDDGTPIEMTLTIDRSTGSAKVDFTGTGLESYSNYNAPVAVANSALIYCLRTLIGKEVRLFPVTHPSEHPLTPSMQMPLNAGVLAPIDLFLPEGSLLNPSPYAAVSSGNTETSQRVVDVILRAFEVTAASQGCMNVFR
jgi:5-oxoprolinase (ATP-hydrolysing)